MSATPMGAGCGHRVDRREFVRRATLIAGGLLASLAATDAAGAATHVPVVEIDPLSPAATLPRRRYRIPATDGAFIDAGNELLLIRWTGRMYVFALACPHRGATLEWRTGPREVYCPKHKARFRPDGTHSGGRASRDLDRYAVQREGTELVVDLTTRLRADRDAAWAAAVLTL